MIPRFKKCIKVISSKTEKQQFLLEHNKFSPLDLQATMAILSRFRIEKASLFKGDTWSIDKLRRPFISWFISLKWNKKKTQIKINKV